MKKLILAIAIVISAVAGTNVGAQGIVNPNNTVVRFVVSTGGTNRGTVDVELFNAEKPETVKNFLLYVYSGAYSNLVLHRLAPNFVAQAGRVKVSNPGSASAFDSYTPGPEFGPIVNEYSVGPELSNSYGTISMARRSGLMNSAGSEWFFNLANNSGLDDVDGGFTVFGHVVNTSDAQSGMNFLNYLNSLSYGNGVTSANTVTPPDSFFELPISTTNGPVIRYRDLFTVDAFILQNGRTPERTSPGFTLIEPAEDLVTTNGIIRFSGTASDDTELSRITFQENTYRSEDIGFVLPGSGNWSVDVPLTPGTNHITVRSIDAFGNESPPVKRTIFYSVKQPITLHVEGPGKVTGVSNGQILEVGVNYRLAARPSAGKYFLEWRGNGGSLKSRSITFRMTENAILTARFAPTFLGLAKGKYEGVFFSPTNGPRGSLGRLSFNLSASGAYFGRLSPIGASYPISGKFDQNGFSVISGPRGPDLLTLTLRLVIEGDTEGILVTYSDGHFFSEGALFRVQKYSTNPAPSAGQYTFLIHPSGDTNVLAADAYGFGSTIIDDRGRITMTGALADGTEIKQKSAVVKGQRWPVFVPAYSGRGGLVGFGQFSSNGVMNAVVRWLSPDFPGGTNQLLRFIGSPFRPPAQARLFNWTDGVVVLSGDGLAAPVNTDVLLNEEGSFTIPSNPHNLQLTIPNGVGLFTGSFTHPVTQALTPLRGAVLQSSNIAAGFFGAGNDNGAILIRSR